MEVQHALSVCPSVHFAARGSPRPSLGGCGRETRFRLLSGWRPCQFFPLIVLCERSESVHSGMSGFCFSAYYLNKYNLTGGCGLWTTGMSLYVFLSVIALRLIRERHILQESCSG